MDSAVGRVFALGNVGNTLVTDDYNTYFSRDAGRTWKRVAQGSYIYEFGDHGAVLLIGKNKVPTSEIMFSWNEGFTWETCKVFENDLQLVNIMSGSGPAYGTTLQFIAYGNLPTGQTVLVQLDFSELHDRMCQGYFIPGTPSSDYEVWNVHPSVGACVLGKTTSYIRRKQLVQCYNGATFETPTLVERCNCAREDYVCDYCFEPMDNKSCIISKKCKDRGYDPVRNTAPIPCNGTFNLTRGYRLVIGDQCIIETGLNLLPKPAPCPPLVMDEFDLINTYDEPPEKMQPWVIVLIVLLVFGTFIVFLVVAVLWYRHLERKRIQKVIDEALSVPDRDEDEDENL